MGDSTYSGGLGESNPLAANHSRAELDARAEVVARQLIKCARTRGKKLCKQDVLSACGMENRCSNGRLKFYPKLAKAIEHLPR